MSLLLWLRNPFFCQYKQNIPSDTPIEMSISNVYLILSYPRFLNWHFVTLYELKLFFAPPSGSNFSKEIKWEEKGWSGKKLIKKALSKGGRRRRSWWLWWGKSFINISLCHQQQSMMFFGFNFLFLVIFHPSSLSSTRVVIK